ncbi:VOC family protein [Roseibium sp. CAU 1637]|uniref:VOC family protein n=1 Tax=Roseibium limicola TaxID=2816037 RepID=A0A939EMF4_9HYPH|nr:VOC family protein [Roseibium limicola]MBO0344850.1 VOC family protein [Roseibium limicola]
MSDENAVECIPVLPSLDLAVTRDFYRDVLAFRVIYESPTRVILRRETMELHFWLTDRAEFCENSSCYIRGGGIDALFEEFHNKQVPRLSDFAVRPWNMKEFHLHDPHGNLLIFARIP